MAVIIKIDFLDEVKLSLGGGIEAGQPFVRFDVLYQIEDIVSAFVNSYLVLLIWLTQEACKQTTIVGKLNG